MDQHPRGVERRQSPRRQEDARLHYAREAVIAAALAWADNTGPDTDSPLAAAVGQYRAAETQGSP